MLYLDTFLIPVSENDSRLLYVAFHCFLADINLPDLSNLLPGFTEPLDLLDHMDYGSPDFPAMLLI